MGHFLQSLPVAVSQYWIQLVGPTSSGSVLSATACGCIPGWRPVLCRRRQAGTSLLPGTQADCTVAQFPSFTVSQFLYSICGHSEATGRGHGLSQDKGTLQQHGGGGEEGHLTPPQAQAACKLLPLCPTVVCGVDSRVCSDRPSLSGDLPVYQSQ